MPSPKSDRGPSRLNFWLVVAVGAAVGMFLLLAWWPEFLRTKIQDGVTLAFEVVAEFEVEGVTYAGSAIWEMDTWIAKFPTVGGRRFAVRGEAFRLHGGGRHLFLLRRPVLGGSGLEYGYFPRQCEPSGAQSVSEAIAWLRDEFTGPCEVSVAANIDLPVLVEIADLAIPGSINEIPYSLPDGAASCQRICLRSLRVERTSTTITRGIETILPWLQHFQFGMTDVITGQAGATAGTSGNSFKLIDFSTELGKGRMYGP